MLVIVQLLISKKGSKMIETEVIEDSFKAPILKDVKYPVNQVDLTELLERYSEVPTIDPDGEDVAEQYQFVNTGRKAFVKARTSIEKVRKELKAPSLEYGKKVDSIAKEFQSLISSKEQQLTLQCKIVEDNEKRKQEAYEELERLRRDVIRDKINLVRDLPLKHFNSSSYELTQVLESLHSVTKDEYEEFYDDAVAINDTTIAQLQQARTNKVTVENAEALQAKEEARLAEEQRIKDEAHAKEREAFEEEKAEMQKERDEFEQMKLEQQEAIDLKEAEADAERIAKEQAEKAEMLKKEDAKNKKLKVKQVKELHEMVEAQIGMYNTAKDVLNAIIDNKIDHIRWEA